MTIQRLVIEDKGFADFDFRWVDCETEAEAKEAEIKDNTYGRGRKYYGYSANPIRDAICNYLDLNNRHFDIDDRFPSLTDFLNGDRYIYFNCLPKGTWTYSQVYEGVDRNEFIENFENYQQRFGLRYEYTLERDGQWRKFYDEMANSITPIERIIKAYKAQIKLTKNQHSYGY